MNSVRNFSVCNLTPQQVELLIRIQIMVKTKYKLLKLLMRLFIYKEISYLLSSIILISQIRKEDVDAKTVLYSE